jgi:hypothetical protein
MNHAARDAALDHHWLAVTLVSSFRFSEASLTPGTPRSAADRVDTGLSALSKPVAGDNEDRVRRQCCNWLSRPELRLRPVSDVTQLYTIITNRLRSCSF